MEHFFCDEINTMNNCCTNEEVNINSNNSKNKRKKQ